MTLVSIYSLPTFGASILYDLLLERTDEVNISHRRMPSYAEHEKFIASCPYATWYLIEVFAHHIGSVYLTTDNEIGVAVFEKFQRLGHATMAIRMLMERHPRERYLANINPANEKSMRLFRKLGFTHMQNTFELRP